MPIKKKLQVIAQDSKDLGKGVFWLSTFLAVCFSAGYVLYLFGEPEIKHTKKSLMAAFRKTLDSCDIESLGLGKLKGIRFQIEKGRCILIAKTEDEQEKRIVLDPDNPPEHLATVAPISNPDVAPK